MTTELRVEPAARSQSARNGWRRRWRPTRGLAMVVIVLGVLLTAGFTYRVAHKPGVYWSEVKVYFLVPVSSANPNALVATTGGLTATAGLVGKMVDPRGSTARVVSTDVSLANQGIRDGYAVTLPNDGGQWLNNFDKPLLDVQVVGPSVAEVSTTMHRLLSGIDAKLDQLQNEARVARVNRITTSLNPETPQIYYLDGRRSRAVLATVVLGLGLTLTAWWLVRRSAARRESIGG